MTQIIPAAPGTVAIWRSTETYGCAARSEVVIAWAVSDVGDYPPTPIGVSGNLTGYTLIVHPGRLEVK